MWVRERKKKRKGIIINYAIIILIKFYFSFISGLNLIFLVFLMFEKISFTNKNNNFNSIILWLPYLLFSHLIILCLWLFYVCMFVGIMYFGLLIFSQSYIKWLSQYNIMVVVGGGVAVLYFMPEINSLLTN